jgi:hypothetical protein
MSGNGDMLKAAQAKKYHKQKQREELRAKLREHRKSTEIRADAVFQQSIMKETKLKPKVLNEWQTLYRIINGCSISRYGDGEIKHMDGRRNVSQSWKPDLQKALIDVFHSNIPNHLIGVPYVFNGRSYTEVADDYIRSMRRRFYKILDKNKVYGSAYITRGDCCGYLHWSSYWSVLSEIWRDRDVVLVRGHEGRANPSMMHSARNIEQIPCQSLHAWNQYKDLMSECMKHPKESLYLLCVGPTATVMAADLAKRGRQAVDIGHLGMFYRRLGIEDTKHKQVCKHRPTDPGYIKGITYIDDYIPPEERGTSLWGWLKSRNLISLLFKVTS